MKMTPSRGLTPRGTIPKLRKIRKKTSHSKFLKYLVQCLRNDSHKNVLMWNKKRGEFSIKLLHKCNPQWNEACLSFFECVEKFLSERKFIEYKKSAKYENECKQRCKANLRKLVKNKSLDFIDEQKCEPWKVRKYLINSYSEEFVRELLTTKNKKKRTKPKNITAGEEFPNLNGVAVYNDKAVANPSSSESLVEMLNSGSKSYQDFGEENSKISCVKIKRPGAQTVQEPIWDCHENMSRNDEVNLENFYDAEGLCEFKNANNSDLSSHDSYFSSDVSYSENSDSDSTPVSKVEKENSGDKFKVSPFTLSTTNLSFQENKSFSVSGPTMLLSNISASSTTSIVQEGKLVNGGSSEFNQSTNIVQKEILTDERSSGFTTLARIAEAVDESILTLDENGALEFTRELGLQGFETLIDDSLKLKEQRLDLGFLADILNDDNATQLCPSFSSNGYSTVNPEIQPTETETCVGNACTESPSNEKVFVVRTVSVIDDVQAFPHNILQGNSEGTLNNLMESNSFSLDPFPLSGYIFPANCDIVPVSSPVANEEYAAFHSATENLTKLHNIPTVFDEVNSFDQTEPMLIGHELSYDFGAYLNGPNFTSVLKNKADPMFSSTVQYNV